MSMIVIRGWSDARAMRARFQHAAHELVAGGKHADVMRDQTRVGAEEAHQRIAPPMSRTLYVGEVGNVQVT